MLKLTVLCANANAAAVCIGFCFSTCFSGTVVRYLPLENFTDFSGEIPTFLIVFVSKPHTYHSNDYLKHEGDFLLINIAVWCEALV